LAVNQFPRTRDRHFVCRQAQLMHRYSEKAAEKHLIMQLDVQRRTMLKRGIDPALAEQHIQALELAIRAELWRFLVSEGYTG
jgi:hypothetical protein